MTHKHIWHLLDKQIRQTRERNMDKKSYPVPISFYIFVCDCGLTKEVEKKEVAGEKLRSGKNLTLEEAE